jgi:hypothetical protein
MQIEREFERQQKEKKRNTYIQENGREQKVNGRKKKILEICRNKET